MTPELKEAVCALLDFLEVIAKSTTNPIDDAVIRGMKAVVGCK